MDVIIFSGQSNMQGSTGQMGKAVSKASLEYKYLTDELVMLKDPVGEDVCDGLLLSPHEGCGSLVPSFCKQYSKKHGGVVAIHCARGNTCIAEWAKGTERYNLLVEKVKKGIKKVKEFFELGKVYFVWLQGESDALNNNTEEGYLTALKELKNNVKKDLGVDKFGIIKVGYFAEYAPWKPNANKIDDENIMRAQERAVEEDQDFVMLTEICSKLSLKKKCLNPKEHGPHYNNKALSLIGKKAGKTLANLK